MRRSCSDLRVAARQTRANVVCEAVQARSELRSRHSLRVDVGQTSGSPPASEESETRRVGEARGHARTRKRMRQRAVGQRPTPEGLSHTRGRRPLQTSADVGSDLKTACGHRTKSDAKPLDESEQTMNAIEESAGRRPQGRSRESAAARVVTSAEAAARTAQRGGARFERRPRSSGDGRAAHRSSAFW